MVEVDHLEDSIDQDEEDVLLNIKTVQNTRKGQILVGLHVDDCPFTWSWTLEHLFLLLARKHGRILLVTMPWILVQSISRHIHPWEPLPMLKQSTVCVCYRQQKKIDCSDMAVDLLQEFLALGLGTVKGTTTHLEVQEGTIPICHKTSSHC